MTSPGHVDDVLVSIDALFRADGYVSVPIDSIFVSADAFFVTAAALDGRKAAVPRHENSRLGPTHGAAAYFTRNDAGWLQSPCALFVVARTLNSTVVATGRPAIGASTHV
jgi:hypothetical protein